MSMLFNLWPHMLRRQQLPKIRQLLELNSEVDVLDVGCGDGQLTARLTPAKTVVGIDPIISKKMPNRKSLIFREASGLELPFPPETFDRVLLSSVIQMIPEADKLLLEVHRVLKSQGKVVISYPTGLRYIKYLFKRNLLLNAFRKIWLLPETDECFAQELRRRHGATGPAVMSTVDVQRIAQEAGFTICESQPSPGPVGSFFYELLLLLKWRFSSSVSAYGWLGMTLYPFTLIDRTLFKNSPGCEMLMKLKKT